MVGPSSFTEWTPRRLLPELLIADGLIIESQDDVLAVDNFATAGRKLKQPLSLGEIGKPIPNLVSPDFSNPLRHKLTDSSSKLL